MKASELQRIAALHTQDQVVTCEYPCLHFRVQSILIIRETREKSKVTRLESRKLKSREL